MFQPNNFIMPFLAHALGTFVGAFLAALIAATHKIKFALAIGVFFLVGGAVNSYMLPAPSWYIVLDIIGAYLLMAWLEGRLLAKTR